MTLMMRVLSSGVSLEDSVATIRELKQVAWVRIITYNGYPVVEFAASDGTSNSQAQKHARAAMKPADINIWTRPGR